MLDHFFHREVLQELAISVTIFAIVKIYASVCIMAAILVFGQRHSATLAELRKLTREKMLFLRRECSLILRKGFRFFIGDKIAFWRTVGPLPVSPEPRYKLLSQEVRNRALRRLAVIMDL